MKKLWLPLFALVVSCASLLYVVSARAETSIPESHGWVTDTTGSMPSNSLGVIAINNKAFSLSGDNATRTVVLTLMVPTTNGESIDDYALRVAEAWHPGHVGEDRGVVLVIAKADKKWAIKTSRNVGQTLTDYDSKKLLTKMAAYLKNHKGDFIGAVDLFYTELPTYVQVPPADRRLETATPNAVDPVPVIAEDRGFPGWVWFVFSLVSITIIVVYIRAWAKKKERDEKLKAQYEKLRRSSVTPTPAREKRPASPTPTRSPAVAAAAAAAAGSTIASRTTSTKPASQEKAVEDGRDAIESARRRREEEQQRELEREREREREREEAARKRRKQREEDDRNSSIDFSDLAAGLAVGLGTGFNTQRNEARYSREEESRPAPEPEPEPDRGSSVESYDGGGSSGSFDD